MKTSSLKALSDIPATYTPSPLRTKVVSNPVRVPVNRQALRVMLPAPWWSKPLPPEEDLSKKETVDKIVARFEEMRGLLVDEREVTSSQSKLIANLRAQLRAKNPEAKKFLDSLQEKDNRINELTVKNASLEADNKAMKELLGL